MSENDSDTPKPLRARFLSVDPTDNGNQDGNSRSRSSMLEERNAVLRQKELEVKLAELEIEKLKLQMELSAGGNLILGMDSTQIHAIRDFKKEIAAKNPKLSFKLDACPPDLKGNDATIWGIKSEAVFDMMFSSLKSSIRQTIKGRIDEDHKNAAELWIALESEYRIHAADRRMQLFNKFRTIYKDVQAYISDFRDIYNKLKNMGFIIEPWIISPSGSGFDAVHRLSERKRRIGQ
ncbi:hypothetical protein V8E54_001987 [Elaphomyces granulatus]